MSLLAAAAFVLIGGAAIGHHCRQRMAAVAYVEEAGGFVGGAFPIEWLDGPGWPPDWMRRIEYVHVEKAPLDLRRLKALGELQTLSCDGCTIDPESFPQLRKFRQLRDLSLAWASVRDEELPVLRDCPRLSKLDLASTSITDAGLEQIAAIPLVYLNLGQTRITGAGLERFSEGAWPASISKVPTLLTPAYGTLTGFHSYTSVSQTRM
jgi:hypothetical protein